MLLKLKYWAVIGTVILVTVYLFLSNTQPSNATINQVLTDQNGDGRINLVDARIVSPPASTNCVVCVDVNGDKKITQVDIDLVKHHAGLGDPAEGSKYSYNPRFDVNSDGQLSAEDAQIVQNYLGQTVTVPAFGLDDPSELTYGFMANEVLIKFKPGVTNSEKNPIFVKYGLTNKQSLASLNTDYLISTQSNVESLQKAIATEPAVAKVYKNRVGEVTTDDPKWVDQWGHRKIRIEETWYTEIRGSATNPVKVVVLDTGLDVNHVDHRVNVSQTKRNAFEMNAMIPEFTNVTDDAGHGTLMAGIIGATANNNAAIAGLNWNVEIIPVKAGHGRVVNGVIIPEMIDSAVAIGFEWVMTQPGVKVINMSFCLGYSNNDDYLTSDLITQARDDFSITLIAGVGNDGRDDSCYPATHDKVVGVGATKSDDSLWRFSNRGVLDILAPGVGIISTVPTSLNNNGVETSNGTSFSSAYISGVAALCRAVAPQAPQSGTSTRNDLKCNRFEHQGYGRVDAWATIWYKNCFRFDFNNDGRVNVLDSQAVAFRYNASAGNLLYNSRYDIAPVGTDGKIDIADAWLILARTGFDCPAR